MGRYYDGDIEGKFWFGIQSSADGEFFGARPDYSFIDYIAEDKNKVKAGLKKCEEILGKELSKLDNFFDELEKKNEGYNNSMVAKAIGKDKLEVEFYLTWYARYKLGKQILGAIEENGHCFYRAEM